MNADGTLTLFCPHCSEIKDVVTEGDNLVCMDCGWTFDDKLVARLLGTSSSTPTEPFTPMTPRE